MTVVISVHQIASSSSPYLVDRLCNNEPSCRNGKSVISEQPSISVGDILDAIEDNGTVYHDFNNEV